MNKGELVDQVHQKTGITKKQVDSVIAATIETIMDSVAEGDKVTLVGFGSFEPRDRKAREGRNPKTGEKMEIKATRIPAFSAGKLFKDQVSSETE
ncbi:HU family DNA-binding protein [Spirulina sp. CS-785/01]|uniref:HU family DNA-binding protein n=1 Tax=Spirulina sp. CS-785/01 TaxID=3021716 RepID=UPI00232EF1A6|nr:HU family DNA-binding protein [Spirulina sp. CS-785/01]MDB9311950.1 HU family DNA-binding protein [Spirulina sp. CS-785/01]